MDRRINMRTILSKQNHRIINVNVPFLWASESVDVVGKYVYD